MVILGPWLLNVSAASLGYMSFKIHKRKLLIFVCSQVCTYACVCMQAMGQHRLLYCSPPFFYIFTRVEIKT